MFAWISKAAAPVTDGEPSPLLRHLAPDYAPAIAGLWPAPHAVFITAPSQRRHLVCLALSRGRLGREMADGLLHWPLRRAVKVACPEAPQGLARALGLLGETAWTPADYALLLRVLADPEAAKVVRHAAVISQPLIAGLAGAPSALLKAGFGRLGLTGPQAEVVDEAWRAILARFGAEAATRLAPRWSAAASPEDLLERIRDDLLPEVAANPLPPHPRLRHLDSKSALREAAQRYENCLAGEIPHATEGKSVYFEWLGEPGAVVEVRRDRLWGWVLEQARIKDNDPVTEPARSAISEAMREIGVYVGRNYWDLARALAEALKDGRPERSESEILDCVFGL